MSERIYAQVVNDLVNLVGGIEVGLPTSSALCIDVTDLDIKPIIGDRYDGQTKTFMSQEEYREKYEKTITPQPTINDRIISLQNDNLTLMDAIATIFEMNLMLQEQIAILQGGTS